MGKLPLVSILIPNYNKAPYLRETLDSVLAQTYPNWECIIVDDHSTDNSWEILEEYAAKDSRFKIFKRPDYLPKGGNACRNYAFELSKGEYIQWFDSDDLMLENCLQRKVDVFFFDNSYSFVALRALIQYGEDYKGNDFEPDFKYSDLISDYLKFKIQFLPGGPLFKKSVFFRVGLFNIHLKRHQEWELFFRVILVFQNFKLIDEPGFIYRMNNESITNEFSSVKKSLIAELAVYKTIFSKNENKFLELIPFKTQNYFLYKCFKNSMKSFQFNYILFFLGKLIFNKIL